MERFAVRLDASKHLGRRMRRARWLLTAAFGCVASLGCSAEAAGGTGLLPRLSHPA